MAGREEKSMSFTGSVQDLIDGLGGPENIAGVGACFTRLRAEVRNLNMVREDVLGRFPNRGLLRRGHSVQIILGPEAVEVSEAVRRRLDGLQKD